MTPQRVQFPLWCLFFEWRKASINQSGTILHYKRIPVITILWVHQPPSEAGHQSGNFYGKFMWAKASSTCKAGKGTGLCRPQLQLVCCQGQPPAAASPCTEASWSPVEKGRIPHPFWSNISLSPQVLIEFLVKTAGTVNCFWLGWLCFANSVWILLPSPPYPSYCFYFGALL